MQSSSSFIDDLSPREKRYDLEIDPDLFISVLPNGSKTWVLCDMVLGKPRRKTLGVYPEMSLGDARDAAAAIAASRLNLPAPAAAEKPLPPQKPAAAPNPTIRNGRIVATNAPRWPLALAAAAGLAVVAGAVYFWTQVEPEVIIAGDDGASPAPAATDREPTPTPQPAAGQLERSEQPPDSPAESGTDLPAPVEPADSSAEMAAIEDAPATAFPAANPDNAGQLEAAATEAAANMAQAAVDADGRDTQTQAAELPPTGVGEQPATAESQQVDARVLPEAQPQADGEDPVDGPVAPQAAPPVETVPSINTTDPATADPEPMDLPLATAAAPATPEAGSRGGNEPTAPAQSPAAVSEADNDAVSRAAATAASTQNKPVDSATVNDDAAAMAAGASSEIPQTPAPGRGVARYQLTSAISAREPTDDLGQAVEGSGSDITRVYFFTDLRGLTGESVTHRWRHNGEVSGEIVFDIGGWRWRVYSSKDLLPGQAGDWVVEVADANGQLLATHSFVFQP